MTAIPKPKRERDEAYLAWIRQKQCLVYEKDGHSGDNPVDAHHVPPRGGGKVGSKTDDHRAVPFCRELHQFYHDHGRREFERLFGIDLEAEIRRLNKEYASQQHPSPRPRNVSVSLKEYRVSCDCWRKGHAVPKSKAEVAWKQVVANTPRHVVIMFTCPTTNERKEVQI